MPTESAPVPAPPPGPPLETLRLHQANERTMLAWVRTGIALMAFGFAIARFGLFLRELAQAEHSAPRASHSLGSAWLGVALVAAGFLTTAAATVRYGRIRRAIEASQLGAPAPALVYVIGAAVTALGVAMMWLLARAIAT
jgi:putative membrane protein